MILGAPFGFERELIVEHQSIVRIDRRMVVAPLDGDRVVAERADLPGRGVVGDLSGLENLVAGHLDHEPL